MMRVYLVRHGQTHANAQKRFAGHWDVALTEKGEAQAAEVAEKLKDVCFAKAVSSDLQRARITAETILKNQPELALAINPEFREMNFGSWEEKTFVEIGEAEPLLLKQWFDDYKAFEVPQGESVQALYNRVVAAYEAYIADGDKEAHVNYLIVAHGGVIQSLLSYLCYGDLSGYWRFKIDNCKVNCIEYVMGMPIVRAINQ
ncbi:alpha-ribazole phosphatase [Fusibacter paucivorans]|uniref:Alpha-ribazole phosphatase n=1 Tax=Fusibacter paucivorans TaxID=76009 RepID=A0ABS5PMJ4_9FIRM|nr:alpha-ribazole phosphatase [Fusibacter paucivorans]MBS7526405.1 alpha-ribazole phosphatase [Fusibacter paucivorans]